MPGVLVLGRFGPLLGTGSKLESSQDSHPFQGTFRPQNGLMSSESALRHAESHSVSARDSCVATLHPEIAHSLEIQI